MTENVAPEYLRAVLRKYFGPELDLDSAPHISRADVERLLTDDGQRRLRQAESAAIEWGSAEAGRQVEIASEHVLITPRGMVYAARLRTGHTQHLYYVATPRLSFDDMVDRVKATELQPDSAAAVDGRHEGDLTFPYPLDAGVRRQLDAEPVLIWI